MYAKLDKTRFGPWALITGASSGIGREFARQIAASGINVVLVARREELLKEVATECSREFGREHRIVVSDLSEEGSVTNLAEAVSDLDIGLVVSNAGSAQPGPFLSKSREELIKVLRLGPQAYFELAHSFGRKLTPRRPALVQTAL